ncbi:MAG TPA: hypothetical protein VGC82_16425, partial [Rhodopila sp.]
MVVDSGFDSARPGPGRPDAAGDGKAGFGDARPGAFADIPDSQRLAQDWITLWQSELSAMAADPEMRESWQTLTALWAGAVSAMMRGMPRPQAADGRDQPSGQTTTA